MMILIFSMILMKIVKKFKINYKKELRKYDLTKI
jgi:hypothetical protein